MSAALEDEQDFQEIFDFIMACLDQEEADFPGHEPPAAVRYACQQALELANEEFELIDYSAVIETCGNILRRFAMEYHLRAGYRREWTLPIPPWVEA